MKVTYSGNIVIAAENPSRKFLIDAAYVQNNVAKPVVLFVHGFKGFKDWGAFNLMANYFAQEDFVFVKMNFSHNGTTVDQPLDFADLEAFGNNNFSIEQQDIQEVLNSLFSGDIVSSSELNLNEVYLLGHSRGGGAVILKASADNRVKKVATLAALNNLASRYSDEVMEQWQKEGVYYVYNGRTKQDMPLYYQIVEDYNRHSQDLDVKRAIMRLNKPFLALHGTEDETLPVSMLHEIKEWNNEVKIIEMEGANHTFGSIHPYPKDTLPQDLQRALEHITEFFKRDI